MNTHTHTHTQKGRVSTFDVYTLFYIKSSMKEHNGRVLDNVSSLKETS